MSVTWGDYGVGGGKPASSGVKLRVQEERQGARRGPAGDGWSESKFSPSTSVLRNNNQYMQQSDVGHPRCQTTRSAPGREAADGMGQFPQQPLRFHSRLPQIRRSALGVWIAGRGLWCLPAVGSQMPVISPQVPIVTRGRLTGSPPIRRLPRRGVVLRLDPGGHVVHGELEVLAEPVRARPEAAGAPVVDRRDKDAEVGRELAYIEQCRQAGLGRREGCWSAHAQQVRRASRAIREGPGATPSSRMPGPRGHPAGGVFDGFLMAGSNLTTQKPREPLGFRGLVVGLTGFEPATP